MITDLDLAEIAAKRAPISYERSMQLVCEVIESRQKVARLRELKRLRPDRIDKGHAVYLSAEVDAITPRAPGEAE